MPNTVLDRSACALPLAPEIPPELYRPIVEQINDVSTLCSLSLTCRLLRHEAERLLYACISPERFSSPSRSPTAMKYEQRQFLFLTTILLHNPRLASLVREYNSDSIIHHAREPLWNLTKRALRCMVNLKVLSFREYSGQAAAEELLVDCPFRLEKLYWGCHSDEKVMATVLIEQQDLTELRLQGDRHRLERFPIPGTACPNLVSFTGNRDIIEVLLPGRRVHKLSWVPDLDDLFRDPVVGIENELGALHTLSFGGYFMRPNFALIAHQLRSLEVLEFVGYSSVEELNLLKTLPSLRELVISVGWARHTPPTPQDRSVPLLVQTFFRDCPKLSLVDIAHEWTGVDEISYHRWTKFRVEPVLVTIHEVRRGRF